MRRTAKARTRWAIGAMIAVAGVLGLGVAQPALGSEPGGAQEPVPEVIQSLTPTFKVAGGGIERGGPFMCPPTHKWLVNEKKSELYDLPNGVGEVSGAPWLELVPKAGHVIGALSRVVGVANVSFHNQTRTDREGYLVLHCTNNPARSYTLESSAAVATPRVIQHLTPTQVVARAEISPLETYACPQETHPWLVSEKLSDWYPLPLGVGEVTNGKWMELVPSADPLVGADGRVIGITNAKFHNMGAKTFDGYFVLHCTNDATWTYP
ncbi:hypothetical protein [Agromyces silvae]|uniref:hypothetical protein n=1 Tax=Agromyces silvae TaxID=3388266 RepID=UPI00280AADC0|nr:hypothetical protein [Agromyces protaetiae]